jgi:hypothetical protein
MVLSRPIAATVLALWPVLAAGQASEWHRYVVGESGAAVDVPSDVFAGKPETGYGARFLTTDRRANLTVQSVRNDANDTPAALARKHPPAPSSIEGSHPTFLWSPASATGLSLSGTTAAISLGSSSPAY